MADLFSRSSSGVTVTRDTALTLSAFWRAVNIVASDTGKLGCYVYSHDGMKRNKDLAHPAYTLLAKKANQGLGAFIFRQTIQANAMVHGNGYAYIKRRGDGEPDSLWPLDSERTWPMRQDGELYYVTETFIDKQGNPVPAAYVFGTPGSWRQEIIAVDDMLHIRGLGFDGLQGYSIIQIASEVFGSAIAKRQYGSVLFKNNARPGGVLQTPGKLQPEQVARLRETWEQFHRGVENAHRVAILESGLTFAATQFSAEDAQLLQALEMDLLEISNFTGVPAHKLGHTARTSYSSLESENQAYLDQCLSHWLKVWEEELWDKLLTEEEKASNTHTIDFHLSDLVRADTAQRTAANSAAILNGWKSRDEVRYEEGYNPMPDGEGEKFFRPQNVAVVGEEPPTGETPAALPGEPGSGGAPQNARSDAACQLVFGDALKRAIKRLGQHASRASKDGKVFMTWVDAMDNEQRAAIEDILAPSLELIAAGGRADPAKTLRYPKELLTWAQGELLDLAGRAKASELEKTVASYFASLESRCVGPQSGIPKPLDEE